MKTIYSGLFILCLLFISTACEDNGGINDREITGSGPLVTQTLDLASFNKISNTGVADFYISTGSTQSVVLKAQQNIIDVMTWEVTNETLVIGLEKGVSLKNHEQIRFDIVIPTFSGIDIIGVGNVTLSGSGQDQVNINLTGVGNVLAYEMEIGDCTINLTGVGDIKVHVSNSLDVTLTGVGDVYYRGTPSITQNVSGVGQLINDNP